MDQEGETLAEGKLRPRSKILQNSSSARSARVVIEVGTHLAWVDEIVGHCGPEVVVADPRPIGGSKGRKRKNDRIDAHKLARLERMDAQSLYRIEHPQPGSAAGPGAVTSPHWVGEARTELINTTRGIAKSLGGRLPKCSSRSFVSQAEKEVPIEIRKALLPLVQFGDRLSHASRKTTARIEEMASEKYGHTTLLR